MKHRLLKILAGFPVLFASQVFAVTITGYDITQATVSGTGGWGHVYTGSITPTTPPFADYSGGTGTMANGVVEASAGTTQLFCGNTACSGGLVNPLITLFLDDFYTIDSISIFGGNFLSNSIPGAIVGLDVSIQAATSTIATTQFGPGPGSSGQLVNDLADLAGTGLENLVTDRVILSNFTMNEGGNTTRERFSIAEITIDGTLQSVPEPTTLALLGLGLAGVGFTRRRKVFSS